MIRLFIIEDHEGTREMLTRLFSEAPDFEVVGTAASCEEAFPKIDDELPTVVLMDISLPGMSGIEGVGVLKHRYPVIDIVMLTVYEDDEKIFESLCAGACGYLLKSTPPQRLIEAVREVAAGGAPMSMKIARKVVQSFARPSRVIPRGELTKREQQILELLVEGATGRTIATQLSISIETVRQHIKNIYEKLHVHSRAEAVAKALSGKSPA